MSKQERRSIADQIRTLVWVGGKLPEPTHVEDIPKEWTKFGDGEDLIKAIEIPEEFDATACLYMAKKGSYFPKHRHNSDESFICLGNCELKTPFENISLNPGDVVKINSKIVHEVLFLSDCLLVIVWHPHMDNGKWVGMI